MLHNIFKCENEINIVWLIHIIELKVNTHNDRQQRTINDEMNQKKIELKERSRETIHKDLTLYLDKRRNLAWFGKFVISIKIEITANQNFNFYISTSTIFSWKNY
jgi:hypothetical protein